MSSAHRYAKRNSPSRISVQQTRLCSYRSTANPAAATATRDAKMPPTLKLEAAPVNETGLVEAGAVPLGDAVVESLH